MGRWLHVATKYDVEFCEVAVDCADYADFIWDLHNKAQDNELGDLVVWNNEEEEDMFELDKEVLRSLIDVCPDSASTICSWVELAPTDKDFVRIEIY